MGEQVEFEAMSFLGESEYQRFRVWIFDLVERGLVEKVEARSTTRIERNFFRIKGEDQVWALGDPIDPEYVAAFGYFTPLTIVPVDFEERQFSDMKEYIAFVEWLEEEIQKGSVEETWQSESDFPQLGVGESNGFRLFWAVQNSDRWILTPPTIFKKGRFKNAEPQ